MKGKFHKEEHDVETGDFRETITWRIFRIMAEFIDGFQFLAGFKKTVSVFGSHLLPNSDPFYREAYELGLLLGKSGYTIITGGGPSIMEAANKGAFEAKANSVGLNIYLGPPQGERRNAFLNKSTSFHYFFTRKVMFSFSAQAYVFFPGGYGTLDEFTEILCLIQTNKIKKVPLILVSKAFWQPLISWIKNAINDRGLIDPGDMELFTLVDSAEEAYDIIKNSAKNRVFPRFNNH